MNTHRNLQTLVIECELCFLLQVPSSSSLIIILIGATGDDLVIGSSDACLRDLRSAEERVIQDPASPSPSPVVLSNKCRRRVRCLPGEDGVRRFFLCL